MSREWLSYSLKITDCIGCGGELTTWDLQTKARMHSDTWKCRDKWKERAEYLMLLLKQTEDRLIVYEEFFSLDNKQTEEDRDIVERVGPRGYEEIRKNKEPVTLDKVVGGGKHAEICACVICHPFKMSKVDADAMGYKICRECGYSEAWHKQHPSAHAYIEYKIGTCEDCGFGKEKHNGYIHSFKER